MENQQYAELIRHGWVDCTEGNHEADPTDEPCWHHGYFDLGNEPFDTEGALECTKAVGARLVACARGLAPDERGYPDSYEDCFPYEERLARARNYRDEIRFKYSRFGVQKWLATGPTTE